MQLRHLKTFAAVADTLNFTRAAERIHLSQSSVTEQIQALEADLGVTLFDRSRRKLSLTHAGQRLLAYTATLLDLADEAAAAARTGPGVSGKLVIGGLETLCATRLPRLLAEFSRRYPNVEMSLKTANSAGIRNGIRNGDLDVGFVFGHAQQSANIHTESVGNEELLVILPSNHRLAARERIEPADLADEPFLVTEPGCVYRRMFDEAFADRSPAKPKPVGEYASIGLIRGLVEAGLGCALVPRSALAGQTERLAAVPWVGAIRTTPITMMWRPSRTQSLATSAFLATARECLGDQTRR